MSGGISTKFADAREGENGWKIRYGAEPIDLHLTGKGSPADKAIEKLGITAGPGTLFNHNYIEILNPSGDVVKRVHGLGLEPKDGKLEMTGKGRLIGLVVDGKYIKFTEDPIQRDDPHPFLPNTLQHADQKSVLTLKPYTKIAFEGSEREVMQMYGAMLRGSIEINNQDIRFDLFGMNSNTFNAEMREKAGEIAAKMGHAIPHYDLPGFDPGSDSGKIRTTPAVKTWGSMSELRTYIDTLEQAAHEQWETLKRESLQNGKDINAIDLRTPLPQPGAGR